MSVSCFFCFIGWSKKVFQFGGEGFMAMRAAEFTSSSDFREECATLGADFFFNGLWCKLVKDFEDSLKEMRHFFI